MIVKNLADLPFETLHSCFQRAFEQYYVKMPVEKEYYQQRWKASGVNFRFSYGMFDEDKLVGFVIHAIDERQGVLTAYNAGTGVIPAYRGNKIVAAIYQYALRDLKENNIRQCKLEVITKNERAIRAYQSIGFEIKKKYLCFSGKLDTVLQDLPEIRKLDLEHIPWEELPNQDNYSWDHQKESIVKGDYSFYQVKVDDKPDSFFILKPENGYLAQFDVLTSDQHSWNRLFVAIRSISPFVRVNNVEERLTEKINILQEAGLENTVNQYEMELVIKEDGIKTTSDRDT